MAELGRSSFIKQEFYMLLDGLSKELLTEISKEN